MSDGDPTSADSPLHLSPKERSHTIDRLDGDVYLTERTRCTCCFDSKLTLFNLLRLLGPTDRLGVVAFDDEVKLVLQLAAHDVDAASATIRQIRTGWYDEFERWLVEGFRDALDPRTFGGDPSDCRR